MSNTVTPETPNPEAPPVTKKEASSVAQVETPEDKEKNTYEQRKTLAEGVLDFTLFLSNVSQLVATLNVTNPNIYYIPMLFFLSLSFILQVTVGILLILIEYHEFKPPKNKVKTNNAATIIVFIITVINAFVLAFGVQVFKKEAV